MRKAGKERKDWLFFFQQKLEIVHSVSLICETKVLI